MKNFVQIGSNIGNDYFYRFCKNEPRSNIYLIEPNIKIFELLKENYKSILDLHNILFFNNGIITEETNFLNKLYLYGENDGGLSSLLNRKSWQHVSETIDFNPITFNDFCKETNLNHIDLLFIDTEGFDYTILNSIDLNVIDIKTIIFEKWPYDNDDLNNNIKTGPSYLNEVLKKYKNYSLSSLNVDGMESFKLEKNT
jgi:FkbM family methyltransferase